MNSLPDVVRSSQIAAFADDTKVFKEITSTRDAEQLQEDLSDLGIPYPSKIPSWLCHASLDSAVNRPDSKARGRPEARYKVYWIYYSFVTKHI